MTTINEEELVYRLLKRAEIRRQISTRKSVQEGKPDRISDLLEEAAMVIQQRDAYIRALQQENKELRRDQSARSWENAVDRQGGSFDQSEIDDDVRWK